MEVITRMQLSMKQRSVKDSSETLNGVASRRIEQ